MTEATDAMLKKIAALLSKANNTACTEAEAQAFNAKAYELMTKYNITRAMLDDGTKPERGHMTMEVQLRPWSVSVLNGITKLYYCTYYSTAKGRAHVVTLVGEKQNLAMCHAIAVMVLRSIQTAARIDGGGRSFMTGAGSEVYRRCAGMYAAVTNRSLSSTSGPQELLGKAEANALIALDTSERSENYNYIEVTLKITGMRPRRSTGAKVRDTSAYMAGVSHGSKVQLRRNLLGNG